jgi:hypothetical protein
MTLQDLIAIANEAYPDDMIALNFNPYTCTVRRPKGDHLAHFIVRELISTFEEGLATSIQLTKAIRAVHTAAGEIESVEKHLQYALSMLDIPNNEVALHLTSESEPINKLLENRLKETSSAHITERITHP